MISVRHTSPCVETQAAQAGGPASDTCGIVVAGGAGERFGDPRGKQFVDLAGMPLVCWSVLALDRSASVASLVVVAPEGREAEMRDVLASHLTLIHPITIASSGATRQGSVRNGLACVPRGCDLVAVHDGARPLIRPAAIDAVCERVRNDRLVAGAIAANPSTDTLKIAEGETIVSTPDRTYYWSAQTPQVFRLATLVAAHEEAERTGYVGTDDASLVEHAGGRVVLVDTARDNIKVTLPEDLIIAEALLERRLVDEGCGFGKG